MMSPAMTRVRMSLFISLDGYASTTGSSLKNPMGVDRERLTETSSTTRTFRRFVAGDTSGAGAGGLDDHHAAETSRAPVPRSRVPLCSACTHFLTTRTGRDGGQTSYVTFTRKDYPLSN